MESDSDTPSPFFDFDSNTLDTIHRILEALGKSESEEVQKILKEVLSG
jgi:hypothetical protein